LTVKIADAIVALAADVASLKNDLKQAQTATNETASGMEARSKTMGSVMQGVFQGIGQGIVGLAADALRGSVAYMKDAIGAASDMGETTSKIGVIFGDAAGGVLKWAETADSALGQSKQQALDAAATFATFGKSAGLGGDDLNKFSTDFVGLASDLASFNNTTPEQAINAIGAALRGESEPLRAYGVLLDDASMRQKALELGLIKTTKEALTPQQKVLAAQALIYAQTGAAQGDFARTSGGLANQQRILEAQMTNLKTTVGTAFLPIWLAVTSTLNEVAQQVLPPLANFLQNTLGPAITAVVDVISNFIGAILDAGVGSSEAREALGLFPESLQPVIQFLMDTVGWLMNLGSSIGGFVSEAIGYFSDFGSSVAEDGNGPLDYFKSWIDENLPRIQEIVQRILGAISSFWTAHGEQIMTVVNRFMSGVLSVIDIVLKTIFDLVTLVLQLLNGEWDKAGATLQEIVTRLWDAIKVLFSASLEALMGLVSGFDWASIGTNIMGGIRDGINSGASWIYDATLGAVQNAYDSATSWLGINSPSKKAEEGIGMPFVQGIAKGIAGNVGKLTVDVNAGLRNVMDGVAIPAGAFGAPVAAGAGGASVVINQHFSGAVDAETVRRASRDGLLSGLRAVGMGVR